ncbi:Rad52/Rad22 family DNA repair protein [Sulfurimonas sp. HSL-1656]|uniref:Rad52/Rad22 family DNA repair protein n=1 Tax=Thiomicrolovo subterrani TaxID=3131934 RepID=UPI0031F93987
MMNAKRIQRELKQPFSANDLEWRVQASGKAGDRIWCRVIAYVTNRAIQTRLDSVFGIFGWQNEYKPSPNMAGTICGISVNVDGKWVTKWDGAEDTAIESTKGGLSGSMKRAAVQWGIGRYLYDVDAEYAPVITVDDFKKLQRNEKDEYKKAKTKEDEYFYWKPPVLPERFQPKKHVTPSIVKKIEELAEKTDTDVKSICDNYGVDEIVDLYGDEAGEAIALLLRKQKAEDEHGTDETNKS